jgi:hypothetical protein
MKMLALITGLAMGAVPALATDIKWVNTDNIDPWSGSVPASQRFVKYDSEQSVEITRGSGGNGDLFFFDGDDTTVNNDDNSCNMHKNDSDTYVAANSDFAFQVLVKLSSHARDGLNCGFASTVRLPGGYSVIVAAKITGTGGQVGFVDPANFSPGSDPTSWLDSEPVTSVSDDFHLIRVVRSGTTLTLYFDDLTTPLLSITKSDSSTAGNATLVAGGTTNFGVMQYYMRGVWYNLGGTCLPPACLADFDGSGFVDSDDFDAFTEAYGDGEPSADVDCSGFVDLDDYDYYVDAYTVGC